MNEYESEIHVHTLTMHESFEEEKKNHLQSIIWIWMCLCTDQCAKEPKWFAYRLLLCKTSSRNARNILDNVAVFNMSMVDALFLVSGCFQCFSIHTNYKVFEEDGAAWLLRSADAFSYKQIHSDNTQMESVFSLHFSVVIFVFRIQPNFPIS